MDLDKKDCKMEEKMQIFKPIDFASDALSLNVDIDDYFYIKQWQNRIAFIEGDIDSHLVGSLLQSLIQINIEDKDIDPNLRTPIKLFLTSDGGSVFDGFALIDAIKNSLTPVYTINMSHWYSMAAVIGMSGHKRYATPNSSFLIHDGTTIVGDSSSKVQDFMKFDAQIHERVRQIVMDNTNISKKTYNKKVREEWYFFPDEAKRLGVIDGIIGEDISFGEII